MCHRRTAQPAFLTWPLRTSSKTGIKYTQWLQGFVSFYLICPFPTKALIPKAASLKVWHWLVLPVEILARGKPEGNLNPPFLWPSSAGWYLQAARHAVGNSCLPPSATPFLLLTLMLLSICLHAFHSSWFFCASSFLLRFPLKTCTSLRVKMKSASCIILSGWKT